LIKVATTCIISLLSLSLGWSRGVVIHTVIHTVVIHTVMYTVCSSRLLYVYCCMWIFTSDGGYLDKGPPWDTWAWGVLAHCALHLNSRNCGTCETCETICSFWSGELKRHEGCPCSPTSSTRPSKWDTPVSLVLGWVWPCMLSHTIFIALNACSKQLRACTPTLISCFEQAG